jgi:protein-S-isoprenylcysteine O-methyltransferase Ste14
MVLVLQLFNDGLAGLPEYIILAQLSKRVILIMFGVVLLFTFILRKNLLQGPNSFREITLPILMTFFWMLFNLMGASSLSASILPEPILMWTSVAGITLGLIGWIICLISIYNLRYSFGVFVQVRPLVTCGLYRCVRHPIYLGYTIIAFGLLLSWPSISYLVAVPLYLWIMVGRARLEEQKLISYFPVYREYMRNTPFLLPRF